MIEYLKEPLAQGISDVKVVTVGLTAVAACQAAKRSFIYIRNTSAAAQSITVLMSDTEEAVLGTGIILGAGEYFADSNSENYECWQGKISAIASAAGGSLTITQRAA